jgi:hypothetical protein
MQHGVLNQNHNLPSSRIYVLVIENWDLRFICNLVLEICNLPYLVLLSLITTISGELPVRMGGPQVPTPLVV